MAVAAVGCADVAAGMALSPRPGDGRRATPGGDSLQRGLRGPVDASSGLRPAGSSRPARVSWLGIGVPVLTPGRKLRVAPWAWWPAVAFDRAFDLGPQHRLVWGLGGVSPARCARPPLGWQATWAAVTWWL